MTRRALIPLLLVSLSTVCGGCVGDVEPMSAPYEPGEELPGGEGTNSLLFGSNALSRHADNIAPENEPAFFAGNGFFSDPWATAPSSTSGRDGLGPLYNARSCSACHAGDGRGRPPEPGDEAAGIGLLFRLTDGYDESGRPLPEPVYGGQLQPFATGSLKAEAIVSVSYRGRHFVYPDGREVTLQVPSYEVEALAYGPLSDRVVLSPRVAPAMSGLGLLEAIGSERLLELADPTDANRDGISGRARVVAVDAEGRSVLGRFGWKCETRSVQEQSAGAFLGDMGLTSALLPSTSCSPAEVECLSEPSGGEPEVSDEILEAVTRYSQLLAVPAREHFRSEEVLQGIALFAAICCADCHVPAHDTGSHELADVSFQRIFPYTDLLLHDLGANLADGTGVETIEREWRTAPLWGLRFYQVVNGHNRLLHDGRARGIEEAILWHDGEASVSRDGFSQLSAPERARLMAFVSSL